MMENHLDSLCPGHFCARKLPNTIISSEALLINRQSSVSCHLLKACKVTNCTVSATQQFTCVCVYIHINCLRLLYDFVLVVNAVIQ